MRSRTVPSSALTARTRLPYGAVVVKATKDPSGDHVGFDLPGGSVVSWRGVPPDAGTIQTCGEPERSERNAKLLPSGDQMGCQSFPGPVATARAVPPVALITAIPLPAVIAISRPSGESAGSRAPTSECTGAAVGGLAHPLNEHARVAATVVRSSARTWCS